MPKESPLDGDPLLENTLTKPTGSEMNTQIQLKLLKYRLARLEEAIDGNDFCDAEFCIKEMEIALEKLKSITEKREL
jgi:hypothetical protein